MRSNGKKRPSEFLIGILLIAIIAGAVIAIGVDRSQAIAAVRCGTVYKQCGNTILTLAPNTLFTTVTVTLPITMLAKPHISFSTRESLSSFSTVFTTAFVPMVNPSSTITIANFPVGVTDIFPNNYAAIDTATNPFPVDDFRVEANVVSMSSSINAYICFQTSPNDTAPWHDYSPLSGGCAGVGPGNENPDSACFTLGVPPCLSLGTTFPTIDPSCLTMTNCYVRLVAEGGNGIGDTVTIGSVFLEERATTPDPVAVAVNEQLTTVTSFQLRLQIGVQVQATLNIHVDWTATV